MSKECEVLEYLFFWNVVKLDLILLHWQREILIENLLHLRSALLITKLNRGLSLNLLCLNVSLLISIGRVLVHLQLLTLLEMALSII